MKSKQLIILVSFFVLLLAIVAVKKRIEPQRPHFEEKVDILKNKLSLETLSNIELKILGEDEKSQSLIFAKGDSGWIASGYFDLPVRIEKLESLVQGLDQMEGDLRSSTPDVFPDYGISDSEGLSITLRMSTGDEANAVLGAKETEAYGQFVRLGNSSDVYYSDTNLFARLGLGAQTLKEDFSYDFWIDKKVFKFSAENVKRLTGIKGEKKVLDIYREDFEGKRKWSFRAGYPVTLDAEKVKNYLDVILSINASRIKPPEELSDFNEGAWHLTLDVDNGPTINLVTDQDPADTTANERVVKLSGSECGFVILKREFETLARDDAAFFIDNPLEINSEMIVTVGIEDVSRKSIITLVSSRETAPDGDDADTADDVKIVWKSNDKDISSALLTSLIDALRNVELSLLGRQDGTNIPVQYRFHLNKSGGTPMLFNLHEKTNLQDAACPVTMSDPAIIYSISDSTASGLKLTSREIIAQAKKK